MQPRVIRGQCAYDSMEEALHFARTVWNKGHLWHLLHAVESLSLQSQPHNEIIITTITIATITIATIPT